MCTVISKGCIALWHSWGLLQHCNWEVIALNRAPSVDAHGMGEQSMQPISASQGLMCHARPSLGTENCAPHVAGEQEESIGLRGASASSQEPVSDQAGTTLGSPVPSSFSSRLLTAVCIVLSACSLQFPPGGAPPMDIA